MKVQCSIDQILALIEHAIKAGHAESALPLIADARAALVEPKEPDDEATINRTN